MHDWLIFAAGASAIVGVARQIRLYLRERGQLRLAARMFDQTRSSEAMSGYVDVLKASRLPLGLPVKAGEAVSETDRDP